MSPIQSTRTNGETANHTHPNDRIIGTADVVLSDSEENGSNSNKFSVLSNPMGIQYLHQNQNAMQIV